MPEKPETEWKQPGQTQADQVGQWMAQVKRLTQQNAALEAQLQHSHEKCDLLIRTIDFLSGMVVATMDREGE